MVTIGQNSFGVSKEKSDLACMRRNDESIRCLLLAASTGCQYIVVQRPILSLNRTRELLRVTIVTRLDPEKERRRGFTNPKRSLHSRITSLRMIWYDSYELVTDVSASKDR
jgi:hypothetical protein